MIPWGPNLEVNSGVVVDLCYACGNLFFVLEIFCLVLRMKFGSNTMLNISMMCIPY